jgi:hypothetical protein
MIAVRKIHRIKRFALRFAPGISYNAFLPLPPMARFLRAAGGRHYGEELEAWH